MSHLKRPTLIVAFVALVLAGTGVADGASRLITGKQIKNNSVTGADIKRHSLATSDLSSSASRSLRGDAGPKGDAGAPGAPGPAGPPGPSVVNKLTRVTASMSVAPGDVNGPSAFCPSGQGIVSGGYITAGAGNGVFTQDSFGGSRWAVGYDNFDSTASADVTAVAYCAPSGQAAGPATRSAASSTDAFQEVLATQLAAHRR